MERLIDLPWEIDPVELPFPFLEWLVHKSGWRIHPASPLFPLKQTTPKSDEQEQKAVFEKIREKYGISPELFDNQESGALSQWMMSLKMVTHPERCFIITSSGGDSVYSLHFYCRYPLIATLLLGENEAYLSAPIHLQSLSDALTAHVSQNTPENSKAVLLILDLFRLLTSMALMVKPTEKGVFKKESVHDWLKLIAENDSDQILQTLLETRIISEHDDFFHIDSDYMWALSYIAGGHVLEVVHEAYRDDENISKEDMIEYSDQFIWYGTPGDMAIFEPLTTKELQESYPFPQDVQGFPDSEWLLVQTLPPQEWGQFFNKFLALVE